MDSESYQDCNSAARIDENKQHRVTESMICTSLSDSDIAVRKSMSTGCLKPSAAMPNKQSTVSSLHVAVRQSRSGRSKQRPMTVHVELLSNWGHERLIGLTEIELLDDNDERIAIDPLTPAVTVTPASTVNQIDALFNGKYKVHPVTTCAL